MKEVYFNCLGVVGSCSKDTEGLAHVSLEVVQTAAQLPGVRGEA